MKKWCKGVCDTVRNNIIAICSSIGILIISIDLTGLAEQLRTLGFTYLSPEGQKKLGLVLFGISGVRAVVFTWKMRRQRDDDNRPVGGADPGWSDTSPTRIGPGPRVPGGSEPQPPATGAGTAETAGEQLPPGGTVGGGSP